MSEEESISVLFTEEEQALLKQSPQSLYETVLVLLARPCLEVFQALSASFIFGKAVSSPSKKHKRDGRKELFDSITASIVMNHKNKKEFSYLEFAQALQQWTDRWQQFTFEAILSTVLFLDSTLEGYIHLGSVERLCNLLDDSLRSNPLHVEVTVQDSFLVLVSSLHTTLYSSSGHLHNPNNEVSSSKVSALFRRIQALVVDAHRCNIATLAPYLRKISLREGKQRAANQDETLHHDIMTYLQTLHVKTHRALQALQVSAAGSPQSDRSQLLDITQSTLPITPAQKLTNKTLNTR